MGEQPLPKNFSCNLGSINLSEFVVNPYRREAFFDYESFNHAVRIAVDALDNIIDENLDRHALKEQAENSKNYRNIGLGCMGYSNALFKLGLTYGSKEAFNFTKELFEQLFYTALIQSCQLAKEKGAFPKCKPEKIIQSRIIQNLINSVLDNELIENIKKYGLRNCSLISMAPTGSIATMLGITGGIEPEFALSYKRKTDNLKESYDVFCKSVNEYWKMTDKTIDKGNINSLPKYFITSVNIPWKNRIDTQAIIQDYVDTAISSTINLSENIIVEEIEQIYLYAWKKGLKGVTIFRSGCKRSGILMTEDVINNNKSIKSTTKLPRGCIINVSEDLVGYKRKLTTGCGGIYFEAYFDEDTCEPQETFINIGSTGGCERNYQFISRLMSLALRAGVPIEAIVDQAMSIRPCNAYVSRTKSKGDTSKGTSCPSAIGYAFKDLYNKICDLYKTDYDDVEEDMFVDDSIEDNFMKCPECGAKLQSEGGCVICKGDENHIGCGWSKCG